MTQALINNLNIFQEKTINLADKMPKNQSMDFNRVFESNNKIAELQNKSMNLTQITNPITSNNNTQPANNTENNIEELTTNNIIDSNNLTIQNTTQDNSEESITNLNTLLTDLENILNEELIPTEENIKDIIEEVIITEEETENIIEEAIITEDTEKAEGIIEETITAEDTIITNEDPTMNKELNTLEDSTSLLLLQTQIQKTSLNTINDEQECVTKDDNLLKNTNQNLQNQNSNNAIFKQFDNSADKNTLAQAVQNSIFKETKLSKNEYSRPTNIVSENIVKELNAEVLSSQSSNAENSMNNFMQNQSPQEQAARVMIQGDINYEKIAQESVKNVVQQKVNEISPSKIIEQISKQLDNMVNNSKLNIVLNPGSMGKINLQILNAKDGLTALFTVTTQETKDILMKGLNGLKESLLAQGVNIDNVSVKLEETESEYNMDYTEQESSKGGNKQQGTRKQKENEKQFEQMMFELENENNV